MSVTSIGVSPLQSRLDQEFIVTLNLANGFPAMIQASSCFCCCRRFSSDEDAKSNIVTSGPCFNTSSSTLVCLNQPALWGSGPTRHSDVVDRLNSMKCDDSEKLICWKAVLPDMLQRGSNTLTVSGKVRSTSL